MNKLKCLTKNEMQLVCGGDLDDVTGEEVLDAVEETSGFVKKLIKGKYIRACPSS